MKSIAAGVFSVVSALTWQRFLLWNHVREPIRVGFWIPIGEEIIKCGTAFLFGVPVFMVYLIFGLGEGFYEAFCGQKPRVSLVLAGFLTHFSFGLFFILPIWWGFSLLFAILAHLFWNNTVMKTNRD